MVQIKPHLPALIAFLLLHLSSVTVRACMCEPRKPCQAYARAETVFVGVVTQSRMEQAPGGFPPNAVSTSLNEGAPVARFRVERAFRGIAAEEVEIWGTGNSCDFYFEEGQHYLVYAYRDPDRKALYTSLCSGTSRVSKANEHLTYLSRGKTIDTGGVFQGEMVRAIYNSAKDSWDSKPVANAEVVLQSETQRFRTVSNQQGTFEFSVLPPGHYKVRTDAFLNYSDLEGAAKAPQNEWNVDVPDHGCITASFEARPTGEISGEIVGVPTREMWAEILFADRNNTESNELRDVEIKDGKFKFSFLPPGQYLVGFNISSGPFREYPFAELYYPNASERANATTITLREGQRVSDLKLPLPSRVEERTLEGVAVWPNGRPAGKVSVELHNQRKGWREGDPVWTDSQGRFSIIGMEGQTYELSAWVHKDGPLVTSKPIIVKLERENKPVRYVIEVP